MTIQYRAEAHTTNGASPRTVDKPLGTTEGDILILHVSIDAALAPLTVPDDFVLIEGGESVGPNSIRLYWKVAGASEPATYSVTWASGNGAIAMVAIYSDTATEVRVDDLAVQTNASALARDWPSVTATVAETFLACFASLASSLNATPHAGMTEVYDQTRIYAMAQNIISVGPTGTRTADGANSTTSRCISVLFADIPAPGPAVLDASLTVFVRAQAGKQSAFDEPAVPTFTLPVVFEYQDADQDQLAAWDRGTWTPTEIVERVARFATFKLGGALFFELLPVLLSAGFGAMTPTGVGPYSYSGSAAPGAAGEPAAYTFRFGGNDGNRSAQSMVQVQDAYLRTLTLTFNLNTLVVLFTSEWFGRFIDDNDGQGYTPEAVSVIPNLRLVNGLLSTMGIQDAGSAGGAFNALDEFECSVIEWTLAIDTGLRPAWSSDGNGTSYCGVRHELPSVTFAPHIRTNIANYALTKVKSNLRQYQELQLSFLGDGGREFVLGLTGRWLPKFVAHERTRGEVVSKPTFAVETPQTQTTTPHWLSWSIASQWAHPAQVWDIDGVVAAYEPIHALSLAESYVNLANPGVNDAAPGVAPTFAAGVGWTFNGSTQYLTTGLSPAIGYSMIVRFSGVSGNEAVAAGSSDTGANFFLLAPRTSLASFHNYGYTTGIVVAPALAAGVMAIAAEDCYLNGVLDGSTTPGTITSQPIAIGAQNNGGTITKFLAGTITHLYIFNATLTAQQITDIYEAIA